MERYEKKGKSKIPSFPFSLFILLLFDKPFIYGKDLLDSNICEDVFFIFCRQEVACYNKTLILVHSDTVLKSV